jgi:hypothetical protein
VFIFYSVHTSNFKAEVDEIWDVLAQAANLLQFFMQQERLRRFLANRALQWQVSCFPICNYSFRAWEEQQLNFVGFLNIYAYLKLGWSVPQTLFSDRSPLRLDLKLNL